MVSKEAEKGADQIPFPRVRCSESDRTGRPDDLGRFHDSRSGNARDGESERFHLIHARVSLRCFGISRFLGKQCVTRPVGGRRNGARAGSVADVKNV